MINRKMTCLALLIVTTVGCSAASDEQSFTHLTPVDAQHFAVHQHVGPDAVVSVTGELAIGGKALALSANQKNLVARYFAYASAVRDDGLATGLAGASTALTALSSVASGLANGEPDKIGPAVDAKAAKIEEHVEKLCRDLRELATTQDALAASLPDFKPYALIVEKEVDDCHHN
jgi:hypothetical protein